MKLLSRQTGILHCKGFGNVLIENERIQVEVDDNDEEKVLHVDPIPLENNVFLIPTSFSLLSVNRVKTSDFIFDKKLNFYFYIPQHLWMVKYLSPYIQIVSKPEDADVLWKSVKTFNVLPEILLSMTDQQHINTLFHHDLICQKHKLCQTIQGKYMPKTWYVGDVVPHELIFLYRKNPDVKVISKPQASSEGRGIITGSLQEILEEMLHRKLRDRVVQTYIETPLIDGKKFDIRMYGFLHSSGHHYLSKHGFLRMAQKPFDPASKDRRVHLTNTSITKNQLLIRDVRSWGAFEHFFPIMQNIFSDIVEQLLHHPQFRVERNGFVYLGLDFIIDTEDRVYLLEINRKPNSIPKSPLQKRIKQSMAKDLVGFLGYVTSLQSLM